MNYEFLIVSIQGPELAAFPDTMKNPDTPFLALKEAANQFFKCEWEGQSSVAIPCGDENMELTFYASTPDDIDPGYAFEAWAERHFACLEELKEFCEAYDLLILDLQTRDPFDVDVEIEDLRYELNNEWLSEEEFEDFDETDDFDDFN